MTIDLQYRSPAPGISVPQPRTMKRFIVENNPFYLLSAACMLLGLMTLTNSLSFSPIPHHRLIVLIGTLNLYEAVLIGLAGWLIVKRRLVRDAEILLAIEALFLADGAMLSAEMFTADIALGVMVNFALLAMAMGKLIAILAALKLPVARMLPPLMLQLSLVLGLPGFLKMSAGTSGNLSPLALYAAWWTFALFPVATYVVWRVASSREAMSAPWQHISELQPRRRIAVTFAVMAGVSMLVHLCMSSWVYKVHWYPAHLTPLALGVAFTAGLAARRGAKDTTYLKMQTWLPVFAVVMSIAAPRPLTINPNGFAFTTLRLSLIGAALVYAQAFITRRSIRWGFVSLGCLLTTSLGATMSAILDTLFTPLRIAGESSGKIVPTTSAGWGAVSVISAFVLLAAGAVVSLYKKPPVESDVAEAFSVALREADLKQRKAV
ncbi:MAG: hypothetical protein H7Z14_08910 [Anaerolineae bacterium]|nr:hypothetical protein [Phycisphaerae bacterium]